MEQMDEQATSSSSIRKRSTTSTRRRRRRGGGIMASAALLLCLPLAHALRRCLVSAFLARILPRDNPSFARVLPWLPHRHTLLPCPSTLVLASTALAFTPSLGARSCTPSSLPRLGPPPWQPLPRGIPYMHLDVPLSPSSSYSSYSSSSHASPHPF